MFALKVSASKSLLGNSNICIILSLASVDNLLLYKLKFS